MDNYGETFRTIREQKGYTMKQVSRGIVSISFLSKFERGDSDISLTSFIELLHRISVTFEEFQFSHNNNRTEIMETFFQEAGDAYMNRNLGQLDRLKKQELDKWQKTGMEPFRCNAIMLNVYESIVRWTKFVAAEGDLEFLYDYLFKVEVWGYYELRLYNSTILLMNPDMVITLSKTVYNKSDQMKQHPKLHKTIISIMLNTLIYLTGGQSPAFLYERECEQFFLYLDEIGIDEHDLHARNELIAMRGLVEIRRGDREKGIRLVKDSIKTLKKLGALKLAREKEDYLDLVIRKFPDLEDTW